MKKSIIFIVIIILSFSLAGCSQHLNDYENVIWSDDAIMSVYITEPNSQYAHGTLNIGDTELSIVVETCWSQSKFFVYTFDELIDVEPNLLVTLSISSVNLLQTDYIKLSTFENHSNYIELDDFNVKLNRRDINDDELDVRTFIGIDWIGNNGLLRFSSNISSFYTEQLLGTALVDSNEVGVYLLYLDEQNYEIRTIENDSLLLAGTYEFINDNLVLFVDIDEVFESDYSEIVMNYV